VSIKRLYVKFRSYFTHVDKIPLGKSGEFSKVKEEYLELQDAYKQDKKFFCVVESADLITVIGEFTWKQYKVPLLFIILFAYLRKPYKWIRNPFLRRKYAKLGLKREKFANRPTSFVSRRHQKSKSNGDSSQLLGGDESAAVYGSVGRSSFRP